MGLVSTRYGPGLVWFCAERVVSFSQVGSECQSCICGPCTTHHTRGPVYYMQTTALSVCSSCGDGDQEPNQMYVVEVRAWLFDTTQTRLEIATALRQGSQNLPLHHHRLPPAEREPLPQRSPLKVTVTLWRLWVCEFLSASVNLRDYMC